MHILMSLNYLISKLLAIPLINQSYVVNILIIVVVFFGILLILGVRKSYKLKAENERLSKKSESKSEKDYEDFTEGHLY